MMQDFHAAMFQANLLYGIDIDETMFEEIGLVAWNLIGNKRTRLYRLRGKLSEDKTLELPCNADIIEAVTYDFEDWDYSSSVNILGNINSAMVENWIEGMKPYKHPLYQSGRFVKFERVGNTLYFNDNYGYVNVLYHGVILDESGLPQLNDKEVMAIASYVAYAMFKREYYVTRNRNMLEQSQVAQQDWLKYCDNARIPEHLTQNDMNEILDARSSWNRKIFNKSYKPIK